MEIRRGFKFETNRGDIQSNKHLALPSESSLGGRCRSISGGFEDTAFGDSLGGRGHGREPFENRFKIQTDTFCGYFNDIEFGKPNKKDTN